MNMMKKTYIRPAYTEVEMQLGSVIAMSGHDEIGDQVELVKEQRTDMGRGSDSYNVWNEDWSK